MKTHIWLSRVLIAALFLIEIPRYQSTLPDDNTMVASGMGILLSGGAFYIIESWGMLKRRPGSPPKGTNRLLIMAAILVSAVPVIMAPAMVAQARGIETIDVLKHLGNHLIEIAWMIVVTLIPVLTGIFVAYAQALQYSRAELSQQNERTQTANQRRSKIAENRSNENERFSAIADSESAALGGAVSGANGRSRAHVCEACGAEFATPQALSGHKRHCSEWAALKAAQESEIPELD